VLSIGSIVGIVYTGLCAHRLLYKELLLTDAGCECLLTLFAPGGDLGRQSMQRDPFLHGSPVLLIVTHAESDSCALYLMDCSAWPIFRELLGCSIPCLREHPVIIVFEPAAPGHSPDQFRLRWMRPILTENFARSLGLFQKGLFGLPVSLSVVPAVLFDGFGLHFVPVGLDHCVQHNLPMWAEGDVMCLLRRHLEVMVHSKFC